MKKLLILLLLVPSLSWGADSEKGLTAYNQGDYATAIKEWRPLAEQGNASAQSNLGAMYVIGQGVLQNNIYAHMWFNIAASSGNSKAAENRTIVGEYMTSADISKAQELARQCVNKNYKDC
jgi:hypothetical protein